jgi:hypothetical protein
VSSATGHQQSNSGGGSAGQATYWEVRKAKMAEQAREQASPILYSLCYFELHSHISFTPFVIGWLGTKI